jgi:dTDP-4-dehydrorhamnose reductase
MKLFVTGGTGFVGSNIVKVADERHGADVVTTAHSYRSDGTEPFSIVNVDMTDRDAMRTAVLDAKPDAIVHSAVSMDWPAMHADRMLGWNAYVEATRTLIDAANETGAKMVLVSTDWVFDGAQPGATEQTPPNPTNLYGVLKVVCETLVQATANNGAVARVAGVSGTHWARNDWVPTQNVGMGYFVGAVVHELQAGRQFPVWTGQLNMRATPSLASESAEMIMRIIEKDVRGVFHCVSGVSTGRVALARATAEAFGFDPGMITTSSGDFSGTAGMRIPIDTTLDASATAAALDYDLPDLERFLATFRHEVENHELAGV